MKIYSILTLVSFFLTIACAQSAQKNTEGVNHVSATEFQEFIQSANEQLVDIRTPAEYKMGHIEGAKLVDFYASTFKTNMDKLDKTKPVYIYCRSGSRSGHSVGILQQLGFKEIVNLRQGIIDWQGKGYSLITE